MRALASAVIALVQSAPEHDSKRPHRSRFTAVCRAGMKCCMA
ncbi:hypothetical protein CAter10_3734 [Collimonas arenae]|nr:hypothetical protein CAter10_3734 [Collimonas arenae]